MYVLNLAPTIDKSISRFDFDKTDILKIKMADAGGCQHVLWFFKFLISLQFLFKKY